ncbi:hypothetical protein KK137_04485 [Croceibacterium sp. LX-88]|jgi:hypothetical protein|uniref:Uncharacterized protein n=1 Tax=Croceibacterium selenioxidans TaxID=2838833 RepID=A0ABS5W1E2_9SPHN|nr:hypothetical protein [Croceibacterium selenioxidans]MBT2133585.1 hypothetical protein [Croceibacterium selenioxidans]
MAGDRIAQALARIDAAANRIEAAARSSAGSGGGDPELQQKYEVLRDEAGAVLGELDRLIGKLES